MDEGAEKEIAMTEVAEKLSRPTCPEMDAILGERFDVLDDGFVRVVDYMGNDASIVQAARVSYGAGTQKVHEDEGLIRYLMRHRHTTPFEMCEIKLHVRVPMDCWRQWIRHRTASVNEYSTRYSKAIDACQKTQTDQWRAQSKGNKQGSAKPLTHWPSGSEHEQPHKPSNCGYAKVGEYLSEREGHFQSIAREMYEERLELGVAREQARKDLPLSNYTEAYWKTDLHNLFHFLSLRMDSHAQQEIQDYAYAIAHKIVYRWVPIAWAAFNDYRLHAIQLSSRDRGIMTLFNLDRAEDATSAAKAYGWLKRKKSDGSLVSNREREEFEVKMKGLAVKVDWVETP